MSRAMCRNVIFFCRTEGFVSFFYGTIVLLSWLTTGNAVTSGCSLCPPVSLGCSRNIQLSALNLTVARHLFSFCFLLQKHSVNRISSACQADEHHTVYGEFPVTGILGTWSVLETSWGCGSPSNFESNPVEKEGPWHASCTHTCGNSFCLVYTRLCKEEVQHWRCIS